MSDGTPNPPKRGIGTLQAGSQVNLPPPHQRGAAPPQQQQRIFGEHEHTMQFSLIWEGLEKNAGENASAPRTPDSSNSEQSSSEDRHGDTSGAESPSKSDSGQVSPVRFSRLSLQNDQPLFNSPMEIDPHRSPSFKLPAAKRAKASPGVQDVRETSSPVQPQRTTGRPQRSRAAGRIKKAPVQPGPEPEDDEPAKRKFTKRSDRIDSGYGTLSSRENTFNEKLMQPNQVAVGRQRTTPLPAVFESSANTSGKNVKAFHAGQFPADPIMIREPKSSPISQDQLAAEVRGIYASLVVIEAKCIKIDSDQAANPGAYLDDHQNQTLIALHRTLLYEHHDFLMATQHPSSTPALRGLAAKYSMPARMWKHGIHAYLEVLRHRRPKSQEFMVTFIYLAYQMMALLYETVPAFTDTWIECLGDLARYRMAIEGETEIHGIWGVIAGGWYSMAVDRHPDIGRLNHHLGILERPSLLKLFLYSKALTCVIRFPNAKDTLTTLCAPIVEDEVMHNGSHSAEARLVTYHAMVFMNAKNASTVASEALSKLDQLPLPKLKEIGVFLIVTNISAILEFGTDTNNLWLTYNTQIGAKAVVQSTTTAAKTITAAGNDTFAHDKVNAPPRTAAAPSMISFSYSCFNLLIRPRRSWQSCYEALPSVHCLLVWFHSLHSLRIRHEESSDAVLDWYHSLFSAEIFSWVTLVDYLNFLVDHEAIMPHIAQHAQDRTFPTPPEEHNARPLREDYQIRGLIWTQFLFPSGWFDKQIDEDEKFVENSTTERSRVERVQWLGLYLAFHTEFLCFDQQTKHFWAPEPGPIMAPIASSQDLSRKPNKLFNTSQQWNQPLRQTHASAAIAPAPEHTFSLFTAPKMPSKGNEGHQSEMFTKHAEAPHDSTLLRIHNEDVMNDWDYNEH